MIRNYIDAALRQAHYEIIDDEEPYYGSVPGLQGVWAGGKTLEECRDRLADVLEGWVTIPNPHRGDIGFATTNFGTGRDRPG
ncbi:MAG: type II toxin-antitoxin system HicB family antitoxin [Chloroflexi bacterium]|nr:type II toxin-antitoxin system HicB family antitoxin [Chloroflexota bacterium]